MSETIPDIEVVAAAPAPASDLPAPPPETPQGPNYTYLSGARQWLRKAQLLLSNEAGDSLDLSELRFTFQLKQAEIETPNTAVIRVSNMAPKTIGKLFPTRSLSRVVLSAGYMEGNFGIIFDGEIKQIRVGRDNATDTYLEIAAADGDLAYNYAVINVTLAAGSGPLQVIQAAAAAMAPFNVTLGPIPENLGTQSLPRARVIYGMAREVLRQVANLIDCDWMILNRVLTFTPRKGYVEGDIVVLTSRTGLVGMPEQTADGIMARCLLNARLSVGRRVKIDNRSVQQARDDLAYTGEARNAIKPSIAFDGLYRILAIDWAGDTRGQEWYSELTLVSLDPSAQLPLSQAPRGRLVDQAVINSE